MLELDVGERCVSVCNCRLIAQLHDEILYEVEDSQVEQFAGELTAFIISYQYISETLGCVIKTFTATAKPQNNRNA